MFCTEVYPGIIFADGTVGKRNFFRKAAISGNQAFFIADAPVFEQQVEIGTFDFGYAFELVFILGEWVYHDQQVSAAQQKLVDGIKTHRRKFAGADHNQRIDVQRNLRRVFRNFVYIVILAQKFDESPVFVCLLAAIGRIENRQVGRHDADIAAFEAA